MLKLKKRKDFLKEIQVGAISIILNKTETIRIVEIAILNGVKS